MRHLPFVALLPFAIACAPAPVTVNTFTSGADGFDTSSYWIDSGEEVIVFDAQFLPSLAQELLAEITAATDSPVTTVVVTHPNPDKFNGAPVFQAAGAELVMSEATAAALAEVHAYKEAYFVGAGMFGEGEYPALPSPDTTFVGALELPLADGNTLTLTELSTGGVTTTQTVATVGDAVFVGDLVAGRAHAWLEGGIVEGVATPDLAAWDAALAELGALAPTDTTVYPGRGAALPVADAVAEQRAYLTTMDELVVEVLATREDPVAALSGEDAAAIYGEITEAGAAAFPEHSLSYLITYGVYGLAWQHALATSPR
ncbi:MBL fold metallo-hydrolase [Myxococcota bacterium]|nr:MBL fold metallo-hydrolase [Myxococcota bacterium]